MRNLFYLFKIICCAGLTVFAACSSDDHTEPVTYSLTTTPVKLEVEKTGIGAQTITIKSDLAWETWVIGTPDWCSISPASGNAGETTVTVEITRENSNDYGRVAEFEIKYGDNYHIFYVAQEGADPTAWSLYLSPGQKIEDIISREEAASVKHIKLDGFVNDKDYHFIRGYMKGIKTVDMGEAISEQVPANAFGDLFGGTPSLETFVFSPATMHIGDYAFNRCTGLKGDIVWPKNLKTIGYCAFYFCSGLTGDLNLTQASSIGQQAFYHCSGLNGYLAFGDLITSLGFQAFSGCTDIQSVYWLLDTNYRHLGNFTIDAFSGIPKDTPFYHIGDRFDSLIFESETPWTWFTNMIPLGDPRGGVFPPGTLPFDWKQSKISEEPEEA